MYIFFIVLIVLACVLLILAVLVQSPKSGMAANFGASNQVMGVRQTSDFLERFTWITAIVIVCLSVLTTMFVPTENIEKSKSAIMQSLREKEAELPMQNFDIPATVIEEEAVIVPAATTEPTK